MINLNDMCSFSCFQCFTIVFRSQSTSHANVLVLHALDLDICSEDLQVLPIPAQGITLGSLGCMKLLKSTTILLMLYCSTRVLKHLRICSNMFNGHFNSKSINMRTSLGNSSLLLVQRRGARGDVKSVLPMPYEHYHNEHIVQKWLQIADADSYGDGSNQLHQRFILPQRGAKPVGHGWGSPSQRDLHGPWSGLTDPGAVGRFRACLGTGGSREQLGPLSFLFHSFFGIWGMFKTNIVSTQFTYVICVYIT